MTFLDKNQVISRLQRGESLAIELGCGPRKADPMAIGIDLLDFEGVDLVGDVFEVLAEFPSGSVNQVYSAHFFEHMPDLPRLLHEMARVLAPGCRATVVVPHFSNPFYYSDPTHRTPFGLYSLAYFCEQKLFTRTIPRYGTEIQLHLEQVSLGFKSYPPRYFRHAAKRLCGALVNSSMFMREFYEENLCWLLPCYEVRYQLRRL